MKLDFLKKLNFLSKLNEEQRVKLFNRVMKIFVFVSIIISVACMVYLKTSKLRIKDNEVELEWLDNGEVLVKYPQGVKSVTPGQACVIYDGEICMGGGIINEVFRNGEKRKY